MHHLYAAIASEIDSGKVTVVNPTPDDIEDACPIPERRYYRCWVDTWVCRST